MEQAITISQILENVTLSIALVIGGIWTILRYRRLREEKRSMESEARIQVSNQYVNDMALVTLVFLMKNAGSREMRLAVEPDGSKFSEPFYVEEPGSKYAKPAYRNFEIRLWKISVSRDPVPGLLRIRGKC